jgi:hypothetical protein
MLRNLLSTSFCLLFTIGMFAQSFSDDFEAYTPGQYVGEASTVWTTWSGADGGADDVLVVDDNAFSGSNSLYFFTNGAGGPQDLVLPFGGKYSSGKFNFKMRMYVAAGTGGYFNFQGEETVGQTWVSQVFFRPSGIMDIEGGTAGSTQLSGEFPFDQWFEFEFDINLSSNSWNVKVNGVCYGSFTNNENYIASMDLYPVSDNNVSSFWVDDVSFDYDPTATAPMLDGGIVGATVDGGTITGQSKEINVRVRNNGTSTINSFDIEFDDGTNNYTDSKNSLSIATGEEYQFTLSQPYVIQDGTNSFYLSLSNVNLNATDDDECNNVQTVTLFGITPAQFKRVVAEEGTGTWCGWCPRGDVFMHLMEETYPDHFVPIAVHNGDPMTVEEYDTGIAFSSFPSAKVNRGNIIDPSNLEPSVLQALDDEPRGKLTNEAIYDPNTRELSVTVTLEALKSISSSYDLALVLTENGVTGTDAGYNQANYYAGGGNGVMGGFENLGNPIPFSQIEYDYVARAILPGFTGEPMPNSLSTGETATFTFDYTIPEEYDPANMHVISILINSINVIDNANRDGLFTLTDVKEVEALSAQIAVIPNPATDLANIRIELEQAAPVQIQIMNNIGSVLSKKSFGTMDGTFTVPFYTADLNSGVYFARIQIGNEYVTKKIVVQH